MRRIDHLRIGAKLVGLIQRVAARAEGRLAPGRHVAFRGELPQASGDIAERADQLADVHARPPRDPRCAPLYRRTIALPQLAGTERPARGASPQGFRSGSRTSMARGIVASRAGPAARGIVLPAPSGAPMT